MLLVIFFRKKSSKVFEVSANGKIEKRDRQKMKMPGTIQTDDKLNHLLSLQKLDWNRRFKADAAWWKIRAIIDK